MYRRLSNLRAARLMSRSVTAKSLMMNPPQVGQPTVHHAPREERHSHVFDHRLDVVERQGGVELLKLPANSRDRALWLARRAHDHCQGAADPRAHVGVDERRGLFVQTEVFAVLDHADDLDPRPGGACVAETFAKGRLARPETARKGLVDQGDILLRLAILLREIAALY